MLTLSIALLATQSLGTRIKIWKARTSECKCNLSEADPGGYLLMNQLINSNLTGAKLQGADLTNANLSEACLKQTFQKQTSLELI